MNRRTFVSAGAATILAPRAFAEPTRTALDVHKIDRIEFRKVSVPWPRQVGRNSTKGIHGRGPSPQVCVIHTDQGAKGWAQILGNRKSVENLRDTILGKPVSALIDPASGIRSPDFHPLDIVLHDLAGIILGVPVWKLMGADTPKLTKVYSGMIYFDDLDPDDNPAGIDKVLENCRWDYEHGYRQFKLKIGRGNKWMTPWEKGLQRDIDVTRAIHDAFPDCEILVDGNNGFTVETMIHYLEGIEGIPLFWIEEPFHETIADWTKLHDWLIAHGREKTYRADGEAKPDTPVLEALEKTKALNMRLNDICGLGFTKWRQLMPKLKAGGISASPHTWGTSLKTVYTAHLGAALGNMPTVEGVSTKGGNVDFGENQIVDAQFRPSSKPGFGMALPG